MTAADAHGVPAAHNVCIEVSQALESQGYTHPKSNLAIRFFSRNYSVLNKLDSRPLYAAVSLAHVGQKEALLWLVQADAGVVIPALQSC